MSQDKKTTEKPAVRNDQIRPTALTILPPDREAPGPDEAA